MKVTSNIPQVAEAYLKELGKKVELAVLKSMSETGIRGEIKAKLAIEKEAYDTGDLMRSVSHEIRTLPNEFVLTVFASAGHAWFIEHGRKPGKFPNLDALTAWTGRKLREKGVNTKVTVTYDQLKALATTGRKRATEQQKAYRQHLAMIYLVGRAIAKRGIKGKMIFKQLENDSLNFFRADVEKRLASIS